MKATIFGAGNIGRGLVGAVLSGAGYSLTFVDANSDLVGRLTAAGRYSIRAGDESTEVEVAAAVDARDEPAVARSVAESDIVATAVGPPILRVVAGPISVGLRDRDGGPVNVLACENVHPNSEMLEAYVGQLVESSVLDGVGFPNVVVDRIVPGDPGEIDVVVERDFEFVVDADRWVGSKPDTTEMIFTSNLSAYKLRKLWLVNGLHAIAAWLGIQKGHELIDTAINDPAIRTPVESAAAAMVGSLGAATTEFGPDELAAYAATSVRRFADPSLGDATARVARNPLAKLAADERVIGPARQAEAAGFDLSGFADGIAAGLMLRAPSVAGIDELAAAVASEGYEGILAGHCGLDPSGRLYREILDRVSAVDRARGDTLITRDIVIANPAGLHARPAAQVVERAKKLNATVRITKNDKTANANSIMSVLTLGANTGDTVTVTAEGDDAQAAMDALVDILTSTEG